MSNKGKQNPEVNMFFRGVPPWLSGFVCTYHSATLGSSPKHTVYVFIIYSQICAIFVI